VHLVQARNGMLVFNNEQLDTDRIKFVPDRNARGDDLIRLEGKPYHDSIIIKVYGKNKLMAINETHLEKYIYGILPYEVDPEWPIESLKAQAIVSRTFALKNMGKRHAGCDYDLCNEVHCQVYGNAGAEKKRSNKAVDQTRGMVLTYNGELANTVFHACCAGYTAAASNVWKSGKDEYPYLSAVKCRYCTDSPHYSWKSTLAGAELRKKLNKAGHRMAKITDISHYNKTKSGRSRMIKIKYLAESGAKKHIILPSSGFRMAVSPWTIKSTKFTSIKKTGDEFEFRGNGWGHGVGMCQWGARGMSERGFDYRKILEHYYPGTRLEEWEY